MKKQVTAEQLIKDIELAFARIKQATIMLHPDCKDDIDIAAFYPYETWQSIASDLLAFESSGLSPVSAEGFQFLLPAYLRFCLRCADNLSNLDALCFAFRLDQTIFSFQSSK